MIIYCMWLLSTLSVSVGPLAAAAAATDVLYLGVLVVELAKRHHRSLQSRTFNQNAILEFQTKKTKNKIT